MNIYIEICKRTLDNAIQKDKVSENETVKQFEKNMRGLVCDSL